MAKKSTITKNAYDKRKYDQVRLIVPTGGKRAIETAASLSGVSINRYVRKAIQECMERDGIDSDILRMDGKPGNIAKKDLQETEST